MTIEKLQELCIQLPGVTEEIKWEHDLCFCVGGKMFLVVGLGQVPTSASFKASAEEFAELTDRAGFAPALYLARYNWVLVEDIRQIPKEEWELYIRKAHGLVVAKLPKKQQQAIRFA